MGKGKRKFWIGDTRWDYPLIAPTIIGSIVLNVYLSIETLVSNFSITHPFGYFGLSGFGDYTQVSESNEFWKVVWNSIYFCILTVPLGTSFALLIAVLLSAEIKERSVFRAVYFLPMVVAPAAITIVWRRVPSMEYDVINQIIGVKIDWLTNPRPALLVCAVTAIWSVAGYDAILLLFEIQNIFRSYYEAASLDSASRIQQFFKITLLMVFPTPLVILIIKLMTFVKVYDLIYMMVDQTNPALTSAQSLMYLFYRESLVVGNRGYASVTVVQTIFLTGITTIIQFWRQKKWVSYEA